MTAIKLIESMIEAHRKHKYDKMKDSSEGMFFADRDKFYQFMRSYASIKGDYRIRISEKQYYFLASLLRKKRSNIVDIKCEKIKVNLSYGYTSLMTFDGREERWIDITKKEIQIKYYA